MNLKASRIALAQTSAVIGDVQKNVAQHLILARKAIEGGAQAIIFPELSLTGYSLRDLNFEVALDPATSPHVAWLRELSSEITIICGGVDLDKSGAVYNAAFCFEDGELKAKHRKIYPPTYGLFEEMRYFSRGSQLEAFETARLGRIGMLVCEDLWHPALPYLLAQDGAQLVITIAASPTRLGTGSISASADIPDNYNVNREHHASYARLLGTYQAFVNRVGVEDGVSFWGGSEVVSPSGEICVRAKFFEDDLVFADLDPNVIRQARQLSRHSLDEDLPLTKQLFEEIFNRNRGVEAPVLSSEPANSETNSETKS
jgi:predicted amidohydrolase